MNTLPIIAGSQLELDAFLRATPWLNAEHVTRVTEPEHLQWRAGIVLALPGWELAPAIRKPRELLAMVARRNMQLVVLEHAAYDLSVTATEDVAHDRIEVKVENWIDPDKERAAQKVAEQSGLHSVAGGAA